MPLAASGIAPILVVIGAGEGYEATECPGGGAPGSARPDYNAVIPAPSADDEWETFVRNVANRYPLAAGIEVWNEPNASNYWSGCPINNEAERRYTQLLKAAHDAVATSSNPDIPVITGGLAPGEETDGAARPANTYLSGILSPGLGGHPADSYSEAIGLHPYWTQVDCRGASGPEVTARDRVADAQFIANELGDTDSIWVTEVGMSTTADGCRGDYNAGFDSAEEAQATSLRRVYREIRGLAVPVIVIHRLVDKPDSELAVTTWEEGTGVIASDQTRTLLTPKLACLRLAAERNRGSCP